MKDILVVEGRVPPEDELTPDGWQGPEVVSPRSTFVGHLQAAHEKVALVSFDALQGSLVVVGPLVVFEGDDFNLLKIAEGRGCQFVLVYLLVCEYADVVT